MVQHLKKALEQKTGFPLNTVSSFRRMEKLLYANGIQVSYSTLNRLFSDNKPSVTPRMETLNLLSRYLGFGSFDEFEYFSFSRIRQDELYFKTEFEIKSLLLNDDYISAIDYYLDFGSSLHEYHADLAQIIGKSIFNAEIFQAKALEYLLSKEKNAPFFLEFFVSEDDLMGHYRHALLNMEYQSEFKEEKELFKSLYLNRKDLLNGTLLELPEIDHKNINYHLQARYFELLLLNKYNSSRDNIEDYVMELTEQVLALTAAYNNTLATLVIVGRFCRALCYTNSYNCLKNHEKWRLECIRAFNSFHENVEYKAPIYAVLKLCHELNLSLDFYKHNRWENALVESELIISLALSNTKAVKKYRDFLKIKMPYLNLNSI